MKKLEKQIAEKRAELVELEKQLAEKQAKKAEEKVFVPVDGLKNLAERPISEAYSFPYFLREEGGRFLVYGHSPARMNRMPNMRNNHVEGYVYDNGSKSLIKMK
ncbi:MAG TPA: hypothetical protein P5136_01635 [Methanofastidiosum sp.]|nr:hypothetical protein [Methanofastidiosum sp.]